MNWTEPLTGWPLFLAFALIAVSPFVPVAAMLAYDALSDWWLR